MSRRTPSYLKPSALKHSMRLALDAKHAESGGDSHPATEAQRVHKTKWKQRATDRLDEHVNWHDWVDANGRFTIPKTRG